MGGNGSDGSDSETEEDLTRNENLAEYNERTKGNFICFSHLKPKRLAKKIQDYLWHEQDIKSETISF